MCVSVCVPKCLCVLYVVFFWSLYGFLHRKGLGAATFISAFFRNDCCYNRRFVVGIITFQSLLQILDARVTVCVCVTTN